MCHPIKGKVLCTENRAKTIIAIISVLCVISAASTAFEHELSINSNCGRPCNNNTKPGNEMQTVNNSQIGNSDVGVLVFMYLPSSSNVSSINTHSPASHIKLFQQIQNYSKQNKLPIIQVPCMILPNIKNHSLLDLNVSANINANQSGDSAEKEELMPLTRSNDSSTDPGAQTTIKANNSEKCCNSTIDTKPTKFMQNETYQTIIYWFNAIVFALLPLVLIATFNSFLIKALYKSHRSRKELTNSQVK